MPSSCYAQLPQLVQHLASLKPSSILDIGVGNGKMGFIARDLLDVTLGERYLKKDWAVRIDGIEIFERYIQEHQRFIYNTIYIGDAFKVIDSLGAYDTIILGDVLEHFEKERAWALLEKCFDHCQSAVIINLPLGEKWIQGPSHGNEFEKHLSFWEAYEFEPFSATIHFYENKALGPYGVILVPKNHYLAQKKMTQAEQALNNGDRKKALNGFKEAMALMPTGLRAYLEMAVLLVEEKQISEAVSCLENARLRFPDCAEVCQSLDQLRQYQMVHQSIPILPLH